MLYIIQLQLSPLPQQKANFEKQKCDKMIYFKYYHCVKC